ncbi:translation regulator GCD7 [Ascobolus immersus RN42]|uniref:Translation initiation factor eIF2B subunit beta n=1 Tax=Ascobolus immersus RN42 TaxID=1160509 RepID=A0A3N4IL61_ASCIM|nr:translation regulator GCD7 [Ascobolus immersus RN42]
MVTQRAVPVGGPPSLDSFVKSITKIEASQVPGMVDHLISLLKRRQIRGSRNTAVATANLLMRVVSATKWSHVDAIISKIREIGRRLTRAQPRELAVGNIVRRVLGLIREEVENDSPPPSASLPAGTTLSLQSAHSTQGGVPAAPLGQPSTSMFSLLSQNPTPQKDKSSHSSKNIKAGIMEGIREILDELSTADDLIAASALEHIHSNEIILTMGYSVTVQRFLLRAAQKRSFTVIIAEGYPNDQDKVHQVLSGDPDSPGNSQIAEDSHLTFQQTLTRAGLIVILIPDSAVYAMMSRVNKVILGTHAVTANGGLVAAAGAAVISKAAKEHRTPVVVVAGAYKLSPVHPFDVEGISEHGDPGKAVRWEDADMVESCDVVNTLFDYVPPNMVDLYITNLGGHAPSYLYRIVADHYRPEDVSLDG